MEMSKLKIRGYYLIVFVFVALGVDSAITHDWLMFSIYSVICIMCSVLFILMKVFKGGRSFTFKK